MKIKASYHQERLWFIHQLESEDLCLYKSGPVYYNIPLILEIDGILDIDPLEKSLRIVVNRHEALRTRMITVEDELYQQVEPEVEFKLKVLDLSSGSSGEEHKSLLEMAVEESQRPFFPDSKHLIRAALIKTSTVKSILVITLHHLVSDRCSLEAIAAELFYCYQALQEGAIIDLPDIPLHYADFSQWQRDLPEDFLESLLFYWKRQLTHLPHLSPVKLPFSMRQNALHAFREARAYPRLPTPLATNIREFCKQKNTGNQVFLLAAFKILLYRYCGQDDIIVGNGVDNRQQPGSECIVGPVANLLTIRSLISETTSFTSYFDELKQTLEQAYENRDIPFERPVMELFPQKKIAETAFFNILFQYREKPLPMPSTAGLEIKYIETNLGWGKYDLNLFIWEEESIFSGVLVYNRDCYKASFISRFIGHYKVLMENILREPHRPVSRLNMLPVEERHQLLVEWNHPRARYPKDKTIHQLFEEQVERIPGNIAAAAQRDQQHITYRELDEKANRLAHYLCQLYVKENQLVGIMVDKSPEMVIGILAILKIGCGYVPINPKLPPTRVKYILDECDVKAVLTRARFQDDIIGLGHFHCQCIDEYRDYPDMPAVVPKGINRENPGNLAYAVFTSGSTGNPKGVPITHSNLSPLLHWGYRQLGLGPRDRVIHNLSYYFDWSVWEIFITLTSGACLNIVPDEVLLDAESCAASIDKQGVTALHVTPTQYKYLIQIKHPLETLKYLFIGAEKLTLDLVRRSFQSVGSECRVFNMYGPTECTIISSVLEIDPAGLDEFEYLSSVPIGPPAANARYFVLDKYFELCPPMVTGELYIGGDGAARGYLNNPELTAEKFDHDLWDYQDYHDEMKEVKKTDDGRQTTEVRGQMTVGTAFNEKFLRGVQGGSFFKKRPPGRRRQKFYKTGDLARWLLEGSVEFLGRMDHQVKIRGYRIEVGEIENRLLKHQNIREAVVLVNEDETDDTYICAYLVSDKTLSMVEIKQYLAQHLPDYMVPTYLVQIEKFPLNPNGKIDRKALPHPRTAQDKKNRIPPRNPVEDTLAEIWAEVLGMKKEVIGIDDDFFELGGHSLKATALIAKVHQQLDVKLPLVELFESPKLRELGDYITGLTGDKYAAIESVETKEYYLLSPAPKRMYILQQMVPGSTSYNMPQVTPFDFLKGRDEERLEKTLKKLVNRHESLRTSFEMIAGEPIQKIHENVAFTIEYYDLVSEDTDASHHSSFIIHHFIRPFDLNQAPLFRVGLIKEQEKRHFLVVDMHHIISDGVSNEILIRDFNALYEGQRLVELRLQYKDFAQWLHQPEVKEAVTQQENYWLKEFREEIPLLSLPFDYPRPAVQSFEGSSLDFEVSAEHTCVLESIASAGGATLFMVLLAVMNILFSKLSGQEDIIVGSPVAGRRHADLEKIIGMFVNTLALRNNPKGEKTFIQFLKEVKENTLKVFENQEYPFEDLVEKLYINRDASRNPLFDVMFALQTFFGQDLLASDQVRYQFENRTAKFDLTAVAAKAAGEKLLVSFQYCTKLFKKETVEGFAAYLKKIVSIVVENPGMKLCQIEIISGEEKRKILHDFNDTAARYPRDKTTHQLFEEQVKRAPDHVALLGKEEGWKGGRVEGKKEEVPFGQINAFGENSLRAKSCHLQRIK